MGRQRERWRWRGAEGWREMEMEGGWERQKERWRGREDERGVADDSLLHQARKIETKRKGGLVNVMNLPCPLKHYRRWKYCSLEEACMQLHISTDNT
jgi:hypothetical protein